MHVTWLCITLTQLYRHCYSTQHVHSYVQLHKHFLSWEYLDCFFNLVEFLFHFFTFRAYSQSVVANRHRRQFIKQLLTFYTTATGQLLSSHCSVYYSNIKTTYQTHSASAMSLANVFSHTAEFFSKHTYWPCGLQGHAEKSLMPSLSCLQISLLLILCWVEVVELLTTDCLLNGVKGKGFPYSYISSVRGRSWSRTLGSQPAGDSMHSHRPGGGLPPPPTMPTATHTHIINPAVGCHYFPKAPPTVTFPAVRHHRP